MNPVCEGFYPQMACQFGPIGKDVDYKEHLILISPKDSSAFLVPLKVGTGSRSRCM